MKRLKNNDKIKVMFNGIKMHLVPHFPIILLYSLKISSLNIYHAKFHARTRSISLSEKRKSMSICWAQITQSYTRTRDN